MWVLTLLLGLLVVLAITAATGYFVAQEFSYMAVDRSRLKARAAAGDKAAARALDVTGRTSFMLSGAQLGITVTALLVGYVAEPLIGESLGTALGGVGVPTGVGIAVGTVVALLASTIIQMLFGELFPKNLAIARPEPVAVRLASSTRVYLRVLGPVISVFDQASNLLLKALRIEPVHDVEHAATVRDLEHIVADSRASGDLPRELSLLLDRMLDFPAQDVEHAMVPRGRVGVLRADQSVAEAWAIMGSGHSRYPVLDEGGEVAGVLHLRDVLDAGPTDAPVTTLTREPVLVPEVMSLPDALRRLAQTRDQLACVLDEYGGFAGVLTIEDLAEELVGEIADEHDPVDALDAGVTGHEDAGAWEVPGDLHLDEVQRHLGRELPRGDYETLGGLVIAEVGELPEVGHQVAVELPQDPATLGDDDVLPEVLTITVLEVERHVPSRLRLALPPDPVGPTAAGASAQQEEPA